MSLLQGLIMGSGMSRIVQCGHFIGYSALLTGFMLRRMGRNNGLYSIDIDPAATAYAQGWLDRAGLNEFVHLEVGDSVDPDAPERAREYLGGDIQLVFIDSAHQYGHTLKELELWYDEVAEGGFIVLHDVSGFAASFDSTGEGGVARGVSEWASSTGRPLLMINGFVSQQAGPPGYVPYADGCGVGIVQRPGSR